MYEPNPGRFSGGDEETDSDSLAPRIPASLSEALGDKGKPMGPAAASKGTNSHYDQSSKLISSLQL
jgi:hypothetical protein